MKVFTKDGHEVKDVVIEFDGAGVPAFVRHKNEDRDVDRHPVSEYDIREDETVEKKLNNVINK